MTYGNSFETQIADQKFKINKSDDTIRNYFIDNIGDINSSVQPER